VIFSKPWPGVERAWISAPKGAGRASLRRSERKISLAGEKSTPFCEYQSAAQVNPEQPITDFNTES
jgi:hypothetical protein